MIQSLAKQEAHPSHSVSRLGSGPHFLQSFLILATLVIGFAIAATALSSGTRGMAADSARQSDAKITASAKQSPDAQGPHVTCVTEGSGLRDQACPASQRAAVQVPEPASLFMVGLGLISIAALVRRRMVRRQSP
jgi:hypothetical protein